MLPLRFLLSKVNKKTSSINSYTLNLALEEGLLLVGTLDPVACWEVDGDTTYVQYHILPHDSYQVFTFSESGFFNSSCKIFFSLFKVPISSFSLLIS